MNHARIQLFQGPGRPFESSTLPLPDRLNPGEILVEISLATVCGSDLHTVSGRRGAPTPCVLGHEAIGRVVASERSGFSEGQRVTWTLADSCGECPACTDWELPQKCTRLFKYGHAALNDGSGLNGCYASHIVLRPGTFVMPVPDALKDALVAPANCALATVVNALEIRELWEEGAFPPHLTSPQGERDGRLDFDIERQTGFLPRPSGGAPPRSERAGLRGSTSVRTALVQGGGLLGLYACAWLRFRGVERVFCTDLSAERLAMVAEFGGIAVPADAQMEKRILEESGGGVDLALEVAGSAAVIPDGIALLRPGGTYVWAGMVHPQTALALTGEAVLRKCLTIRGVHNYAPRHLGIGLDFLAATQDQLPFEKLVSPPLPLAALDEALRLTESRQWLRVSLTP
jgi:threonine dehydrogenase-like Zn-dependent dehydrogenase